MNKQQILTDFSNKIISNQQNIESEYVELVNENFWSLLSEDNNLSLILLDKPGDNNFEPQVNVSNYEITFDYPTFDEFKTKLDNNLKTNNLC